MATAISALSTRQSSTYNCMRQFSTSHWTPEANDRLQQNRCANLMRKFSLLSGWPLYNKGNNFNLWPIRIYRWKKFIQTLQSPSSYMALQCLASLTTAFHSFLFLTLTFLFLMPRLLRSLLRSSIHHFLGRPLLLPLSILAFSII